MDLTGLGTGVSSQIMANAYDAQVTQGLKKNYDNATDEELLEACRQFEQYFVEQIFKQSQKTIMREESSVSYINTMRETIDDQMARVVGEAVAESGQLGLAQTMYEQIKRTQGVSAEEVLKQRQEELSSLTGNAAGQEDVSVSE